MLQTRAASGPCLCGLQQLQDLGHAGGMWGQRLSEMLDVRLGAAFVDHDAQETGELHDTP